MSVVRHWEDLTKRSAQACCFGDISPKLCKEKGRTRHKHRLKIKWKHPSTDIFQQFLNRAPGASNCFEMMLGKYTKRTEQGRSLNWELKLAPCVK